jgi:hypothetical protein
MYRARFAGMTGFVSASRLAVAGALFVLPAALPASVVTFAQFQEATGSSNANVFAYLNNGSDGDAQLITQASAPTSGLIPVTFTYLSQSGLPADLQGTQDAMLSLTSSTQSSVQTSGTLGEQQINGSGLLTDVLTITRDTPASQGNGARTNLLTMTFTGNIVGVLGGTAPQLEGNSNLGDTITYTSDFLNFTGDTEENYSVTFSSWISTADGSGLEIADDNYFASATAAGDGTFDANAASVVTVPEPATMGLATVAFVPMLLRRRKRSNSPA